MKPLTLTSLVVVASLMAACGTTMNTQADAGFLSGYEGLATTEDNSEARIQTRVSIDPSRYDELHRQLAGGGRVVQMFCRVGYGAPQPKSPRRELDSLPLT